MPFDQDALALLAPAKEISIETSVPGGPTHSAIVWVVVDGKDVFVRSWLGERGRWYREVVANPEVTLVVGDRRLAANAMTANDPESIRRCSDGFMTKYRKSKSALAMIQDDILNTTLRLEPA